MKNIQEIFLNLRFENISSLYEKATNCAICVCYDQVHVHVFNDSYLLLQVLTAIQYSNMEYNSNYSQPIWKRCNLEFSPVRVPPKLNHNFANFGPYVYNVFYKLVSHHLTVSPILSTSGNQIQVGNVRFRDCNKDGVTYEVCQMDKEQDESNIKHSYIMPAK